MEVAGESTEECMRCMVNGLHEIEGFPMEM